MIFFLIFYFIVSNINIFSQIPVCQVGVKGKCLGDPYRNFDSGDLGPDPGLILFKNTTDYNQCASLCNEYIVCYMAGFETQYKICSLYQRISYIPTMISDTKFYLWHCCNTNSSYTVSGRCPGFWKYFPESISDNTLRSSDPLKEFKGINEVQCQIECFQNDICGAVNTIDQNMLSKDVVSCQLIIQFPVENLTSIEKKNWKTCQWQCAYNYSLPPPEKDCFPRTGHRFGYWVIDGASMFIRNTTKHLIYFNTMNYKKCLDNCVLYPNCKRAWYSNKEYYCILEADERSSCAGPSPEYHYTFITYIWKYCPSIIQQKIIKKVNEPNCRVLINNEYTYIYQSKCGFPPKDTSTIYPCTQSPKIPCGTIFSLSFHCQINQAFIALDKKNLSFPNFLNLTWQRVFTGYETFWLVNVTEKNFPQISNDACNIFSASFQVSNYKSLKIIKRTEWFAAKSLSPEIPFSDHPVKYLIITDTERPFCNCFSVEACSSIMRRIQMSLRPKFRSVPFSFVVSGDGVAYEARGWDFQPSDTTPEYFSNSLAIAFCGRYKKSPDLLAISSVKKLIKMAIKLKKLSENYTMYIFNDIMCFKYPYGGLRRMVELWPHYRGYVKEDCRTTSITVIFMNIIAVLVCSIILIIIINYFVYKIHHDKNCFPVRRCRIESIYTNFIQQSMEILPHISLKNFNDICLEERFVSIFSTSIFWIEDISPLADKNTNIKRCSCQTSIFGILDLKIVQSELLNVSILIPHPFNCSKKSVFIFQRNVELGIDYFLILHFNHSNSFNRCIFHLHHNKCICDHFRLIEYVAQPNRFVLDSLLEVKTSVEKKNRRIRSILQDKYTYVIEAKTKRRRPY